MFRVALEMLFAKTSEGSMFLMRTTKFIHYNSFLRIDDHPDSEQVNSHGTDIYPRITNRKNKQENKNWHYGMGNDPRVFASSVLLYMPQYTYLIMTN